ncbi:MAG: nuclear transport factor 2 family protein [Kordiimonas sp.]
MYLIKCLVLAITVSSVSTVGRAEPVIADEYAAVIETANNYFIGLANGDQDLIARTFDMEAGHMKRVGRNKETGKTYVEAVPFKEFAAFYTKPRAEKLVSDIVSVDIVDSHMALVKLHFNTPKVQYVDYLVMYKLDAGWRIVNKTFSARPKAD